MTKNKLGSGSGYGQRKMTVERLEKRSMLAGNVFIDDLQLSVGNLFITGDNKDNGVLISEVPDGNPNDNAHSYIVAGFDFGDSPVQLPSYFQSGPTNIKGGINIGLGNSARLVTGVKYVVNIDLKKGDDVLAVGNSVEDMVALAEGCGFGIGLGSGSGSGGGSASSPVSNVEVTEQPIEDDLLQTPNAMIINTGDGNDAVVVIAHVGTAIPLGVGGSLVINTGNGDDAVAVGNGDGSIFDDIQPNQEEPNGIPDATMLELVVTTGKGRDLVCIDHATISAGVAIVTGDGEDTVHGHEFGAAAVTINTGNSSDVVELESFDVDATLTIVTLGGHDSVFAEDFSAGQGHGGGLPIPQGAGAVTVSTGDGNDSVELVGFDASSVVIDTGAGNDGSALERGTAPVAAKGSIIALGPVTVADAEIFTDTDHDHDIDEGELLGPLVIVLGSGNDVGRVDFVDALLLTASLGAGKDSLTLDDLFIGTNLVVDAGAGNDSVFLFDSTIGLITQFLMGAGNDSLDIFESQGGSNAATLICDGGPGKHDVFDSDLRQEGPGSDPIDANGLYQHDGNGVPHIIITNFEDFFFDEEPLVLGGDNSGKPRKGWL